MALRFNWIAKPHLFQVLPDFGGEKLHFARQVRQRGGVTFGEVTGGGSWLFLLKSALQLAAQLLKFR